MKLAVLFSGGKDSTYALYKAMEKNKVECLISIQSENKASYMFHTPNISLVEMQAKAIGLPIIVKKTKGEKEKELEELKEAIEKAKEQYKIEGVVTGAIESVYQAIRVQKICDELKLWCFNPLWQKDQLELLNELVENKFKVIISGVFAEPFDERWLGKEINKRTINELIQLKNRYKINPSGEGGEYESTVLDGPIFEKSIEIIESDKEYKNYAGNFVVSKAELR